MLNFDCFHCRQPLWQINVGITFQDTLTFDEHISKITSTSNSRLGIIRNTFLYN